jgi:hypothetical protein
MDLNLVAGCDKPVLRRDLGSDLEHAGNKLVKGRASVVNGSS